MVLTGPGAPRLNGAEWTTPVLALAELPSVAGWCDCAPLGGGYYQMEYVTTSPAEFNRALELFALIDVPRVELHLHDGPTTSQFHKPRRLRGGAMPAGPAQADGEGALRYNWSFSVWGPRYWHRLQNNPRLTFYDHSPGPVPPPRIDLYLGGGNLRWEDVHVPGKVVVVDKRARSSPVPLTKGSAVGGKLRDLETGKPLEGAEVRLCTAESTAGDEAVMSGRTAADGTYLFSEVPPGYYYLRGLMPGYASRVADEYLSLRKPRFQKQDLELALVGQIGGRLLTPKGEGVAGVSLQVTTLGPDAQGYATAPPWRGSLTVTTDAGGWFADTSLPKGYASLRPGWAKGSGQVPLATTPWIEIPTSGVVLRTYEPGRVEVMLRRRAAEETSRSESRGAVPAGGGMNKSSIYLRPSVLAAGTWLDRSVDESTTGVLFPDVQPGDYWVGLPPAGREPANPVEGMIPVEVRPGTTVTVEVEIPAGKPE